MDGGPFGQKLFAPKITFGQISMNSFNLFIYCTVKIEKKK